MNPLGKRGLARLRGLLILAGLMAIGIGDFAAGGAAYASGDAMVLADSGTRGEPIKLGANPTRVPLGTEAMADIAQNLRALGSKHLYLVLNDVRAERQPGVLFEVLLGVEGEGSSPGAERRIGHFNLFEPRKSFLSFDVTEAVQELLVANPSTSKFVVIIQPARAAGSRDGGREAPGEARFQALLDQAEISVGSIRLVAQ